MSLLLHHANSKLVEFMTVTALAINAAATIRRELEADLHRDQRFGHLNTNEKWPRPVNHWVNGAVQCVKCVSCDTYWETEKSIRSHLLRHFTTTERETHFRAHPSGSWYYLAPSSHWCISVMIPGKVRGRLVPVTKASVAAASAAVPSSASAAPPLTHSTAAVVESRVPLSRGTSASNVVSSTVAPIAGSAAGVHTAVPAVASSTVAPTAGSAAVHTCCCGKSFELFESLKRHHNGCGKRPREAAHPCTEKDITRARGCA
jgi:hypothetical protein